MATQSTRLQEISLVRGAAVALLGVVGLSLIVNTTCPLSGFFEIPLRTVGTMLQAVISATWQFLVPCLLNHMGLLDCILHLTTCGWQIFLAFTGAA